MNFFSPEIQGRQSARLLTVEMISTLLASVDSRELSRKLAEQLRELTGAGSVLLLAHRRAGGPCELLHACPARRATLFPDDELQLFCPEITPDPLPRRAEELAEDHLLRKPLSRAGVRSLLRFPLRAGGELIGVLLLLDLPALDRLQDATEMVTLLTPPIALALRNALAHEQLERQNQEIQRYSRDLELRVNERTAELAVARQAALSITEEAIQARNRVEQNNVALRREMEDRQRLVETQLFLLQCGYRNPDEDFFQSLARHLAESLSMDYVCIDRLEGDCLTAKTVAVYSNGRFEDSRAYTLKDTPCGDVVGKTICCFPKDVRHLFPKDAALQEMNAESYVGTTLWSSDGTPIGLIAVIGRKPLENSSLAESILRLMAIRAAGELERKRAEEALRTSLEEKMALLKEVHHRVKNNLQIVSSLLNLQGAHLEDPQARDILEDTRNRIRSMSLLHETLYQSQGVSRVRLDAYIKSLCVHLFHSFGPGTGRIRLEQRLGAVELAMDQAVPCGLIINELLSNALKHAFPGERSGTITLELQARSDRQVLLMVADDGVGLPSGLNMDQSKTLGLRLVFMLAKQLRGTVEIIRDAGATFNVSFQATAEPEAPS
jgi:two-component sensor histidine kinase